MALFLRILLFTFCLGAFAEHDGGEIDAPAPFPKNERLIWWRCQLSVRCESSEAYTDFVLEYCDGESPHDRVDPYKDGKEICAPEPVRGGAKSCSPTSNYCREKGARRGGAS